MDRQQTSTPVTLTELLRLVDTTDDIDAVFSVADELVGLISRFEVRMEKMGKGTGLPTEGLTWVMGELKDRLREHRKTVAALFLRVRSAEAQL